MSAYQLVTSTRKGFPDQIAALCFSSFWGKEQTKRELVIVLALVASLHLYAIISFLKTPDNITPAQPLPMAVSMITIAAPKPASVAPTPPTPKVEPEKKPEPKKPPAEKPVVKKTPVIVQKTRDYAPEQAATNDKPAPAEPTPATTPAASESKQPSVPSDQFTEANYRANYLHNPKPEYPSIARSREWTGMVKLRVLVSVEGRSETVEVEHSSGHDMLDQAAVEAVKNWRFVAAKRGDTTVASTVIVPINFQLND